MQAMIFVRLDASKNAGTVAANIRNDPAISVVYVVPNMDFQIEGVTQQGADVAACIQRIDDLAHVTLAWSSSITG